MHPPDLSPAPGGRVALVTGSSRGIGRATVAWLAAQGADCVVHYRRDAEAAASAARAVEATGRRALVCQAELAEPGQVEELVERAVTTFGRLDIVVANAASSAFKPLLELRPHHVGRTLDTIVGSFLTLARAAGPWLTRNDGGPKRLVAVSGFDTVRVIPDHGLLAAAKGALEQLTRYLAVELAPAATVNAVVPGYVDTDSARFYAEQSLPGGWEAAAREWAAATPLGRLAQPEEIAEIIGFLCTARAGWLTGQLLVADGGLTLR